MAVLNKFNDLPRDFQDFTVDGKCSNCGQCCSNILPVGKHEAERIRWYIKKHQIKEQIRRYPTRERVCDLTCPFRSDSEKKCLIYPVRPAICQDFQCDKPKKGIAADKTMYHEKYPAIDMRATFYGAEPALSVMMALMKKEGGILE